MPRTIELLPGESLTLRSGITVVAARDAAGTHPTTITAAAGEKTEVFVLPAGTICKRNGIPFALLNATQIECDAESYRTLFSQEWQLSSNPAQAAGLPVMSTTNTSSLESMRDQSQSRNCTVVQSVETIHVESKQCQ